MCLSTYNSRVFYSISERREGDNLIISKLLLKAYNQMAEIESLDYFKVRPRVNWVHVY